MLVLLSLVAEEPAPLAATPTPPELQATAAEVAPTVASMVPLLVDFRVRDPPDCNELIPLLPLAPLIDALVIAGESALPILLLATAAPIDKAPPLPEEDPLPAPAMACTWAVIVSLVILSISREPLNVAVLV